MLSWRLIEVQMTPRRKLSCLFLAFTARPPVVPFPLGLYKVPSWDKNVVGLREPFIGPGIAIDPFLASIDQNSGSCPSTGVLLLVLSVYQGDRCFQTTALWRMRGPVPCFDFLEDRSVTDANALSYFHCLVITPCNLNDPPSCKKNQKVG